MAMVSQAPYGVPTLNVNVGKAAYLVLFVAVAFVVLFPGIDLLLTSFQVGQLGQPVEWGLGNWRQVFSNSHLAEVFWNTVTLSIARQAIALLLGIGIAWLIARTNLPGRTWIELGFWVALFMPALPVVMSWVLLAGGEGALLNSWIAAVFPSFEGPLFNVYSWGGIVWLHILTGTLPVKVFLLAPAFRNMDASMEESARTCGSGLLGTLRGIVVPIMIPTILVVLLLGMIRSLQSFEIELILGTPASIDVYSTVIYRAMRQEPPLYGEASALSICLLALVIPFVLLQQRFARDHSHATLGGRFSVRLQDLGRWKWPLFSLLAALLAFMTIIPAVVLVAGSFMKMFGNFDLPDPWTTKNWIDALSRDDLVHSLVNTLLLGAGSAVIGMVLFSVLAYLLVRTRLSGRNVLDFLTWMLAIIPGIVISLAFLQMFVKIPLLRPLYGTVWILIIAVVMSSLTVGVQIVKGTLLQLSSELEEASATVGASRVQTFFRVVVPLIAPAIVSVGLQTFAVATSVVSVIALLGTGETQPLSILQLVFLDSGKFEPAAIVGLMIMAITIVAALMARWSISRYGVSRE